jgi:hypothetical protein
VVRNYFTKNRWTVDAKEEFNSGNEFVVVTDTSVARTPDMIIITSGEYL